MNYAAVESDKFIFSRKDSTQKHVLIGVCGSAAACQVKFLLTALSAHRDLTVRVVLTKAAIGFINPSTDHTWDNTCYYTDDDHISWKERGFSILHMDLVHWADLFVIVPLTANSLAKISHGLCDNLLTLIVRSWNRKKPLLFCPAMNPQMYRQPFTKLQRETLKRSLGFIEIKAVVGQPIRGEKGVGALAPVSQITAIVVDKLSTISNEQETTKCRSLLCARTRKDPKSPYLPSRNADQTPLSELILDSERS